MPDDTYRVQRQWETSQSTCGQLSIEGVVFCFTLEPAAGKRIPAGTYQVHKSVTFSPRLLATLERLGLDPITPRLFNVPGWPNDDVEIHMGNVPEETEGCTLVGFTHSPNMIGQSDAAFVKLMSKLPNEFVITYADVPATPLNLDTGVD